MGDGSFTGVMDRSSVVLLGRPADDIWLCDCCDPLCRYTIDYHEPRLSGRMWVIVHRIANLAHPLLSIRRFTKGVEQVEKLNGNRESSGGEHLKTLLA